MTSLRETLMRAFLAESADRERYEVYAQRALSQKRPDLARLFRALTFAKSLSGRRFLKAAGEVGRPEQNLATALEAESAKAIEYVAWRGTVQSAGNARAEIAVRYGAGACESHVRFLSAASTVGVGADGRDGPPEFLVCGVCGYFHPGEDAPETCPVCGAPGKVFLRIT